MKMVCATRNVLGTAYVGNVSNSHSNNVYFSNACLEYRFKQKKINFKLRFKTIFIKQPLGQNEKNTQNSIIQKTKIVSSVGNVMATILCFKH